MTASAEQGMIVEKKVFELEHFTTVSGRPLKAVRIGWESYGQLNADRSNAILVTHFFSATSHAAGRYSPADTVPGYWDAIIGPGKAIDTDRYFVLSSDTLVNINVHDPMVTTTGPASLNPDTGEPHGMSFPVVSIRDFVNVQKLLVESLGIQKLRAVIGPSMGALQAYEWATAYPDMVERIVPVIGAAGGDPFLIAWLDIWAQPIRLDPNWRNGDYYGREAPVEGVRLALKTIMLHANQAEWASGFGKAPAELRNDPAETLSGRFMIEQFIDQACAARAPLVDGNTLLYMVRANQLAGADPARIRAPTLIVHSPTDLVFPQPWIERTAAAIAANGVPVKTVAIGGPNGHLNGVLHVAQAGPAISAFLGS
jgi:homoserine O-acetyltransferase